DADKDNSDDERPSRRRSRSKAKSTPEADVAATAEAPERGGGGGRWLDVAVGGRGFSRNLSYNQDPARALREYKLAVGAAAVFDGAFYPGALATSGALANIGIVLDIEQA